MLSHAEAPVTLRALAADKIPVRKIIFWQDLLHKLSENFVQKLMSGCMLPSWLWVFIGDPDLERDRYYMGIENCIGSQEKSRRNFPMFSRKFALKYTARTFRALFSGKRGPLEIPPPKKNQCAGQIGGISSHKLSEEQAV